MTERSNLFVPEVLADSISGAIAGMNLLAGTGAVVTSNDLPESNRGGDTVRIPYFGHLGEFEDVAEGAALSIATLTSSAESAIVQRSGKAFEITNWADRAAAGDPYAEAARQMAEGVQRRADNALITLAKGTPLLLDRSSASLSYEDLVDALALFGDEEGDVVAWGVHSAILATLRKMEDTAGRLLFVEATSDRPPTILGKPVIVSDKLVDTAPVAADPDAEPPVSAVIGLYDTLVFTRNSLAFWYNGQPSVDTDKDILVDSKVAAVNMYFAAHRYNRLPGRTKPGVARILSRA